MQALEKQQGSGSDVSEDLTPSTNRLKITLPNAEIAKKVFCNFVWV